LESESLLFIKSIDLDHKLNKDISVITHYLIRLIDVSNTYAIYNITNYVNLVMQQFHDVFDFFTGLIAHISHLFGIFCVTLKIWAMKNKIQDIP
jgi:hypothetical protein